jgi:hypothetical protein
MFSRYLCCGITSVVDVGGQWNFEVQKGERTAAPRVAVAGSLSSVSRESSIPAIRRSKIDS